MKRIITVLFAALFCLCAQTYAQNRADELMKQAQESLAKKNISRLATCSYKPIIPLLHRRNTPRQWNVASMPAPSITARTIIKKHSSYCAMQSN